MQVLESNALTSAVGPRLYLQDIFLPALENRLGDKSPQRRKNGGVFGQVMEECHDELTE